jgi:phage terminase large subunit-like protein
LKDNVIYSETQRRRSADYLKAVVMGAVEVDGQTIVVGTPFHQNDMYGEIKGMKGWKYFEYPAIFPDGKLLTKRLPFDVLMQKREELGTLIFSREMLVRPIVSDSSIFPFSILKRSFINMQDKCLVQSRENYPIKFTKIVSGHDFAISSSIGADFTVFTVWGITEEDEMHLLYFWRKKGASYVEQITQMKYIDANFKCDVMVVENNQFQQIFVEDATSQGLPVFPHTTGNNKNDLRKGWPGLAILFERGKIKLPRGDQFSIDATDLICSEFSSVSFTVNGLESVGQHDDTCSSTWLASIGKDKITTGLGLSYLEI